MTQKITVSMKVAEVLEQYPQTVEVFVKYGFGNITNPVMRRTVAKVTTVKAACEMRNVSCEEFVNALNEFIQ